MKTFCAGLLVASLVAVSGCNTSSSGGSSEAGTFKLKGPTNTPETTVKRKEPKTVEITIDHDAKFKEDIDFTATVEGSPKGVKATVKPAHWKASDGKKVELHIGADDDAPKGDYTVKVEGKPAKGNPVALTVNIKVPEKE